MGQRYKDYKILGKEGMFKNDRLEMERSRYLASRIVLELSNI